MSLGTIKWYNEQKGYGFIQRPEGEDLFVHVTGVKPGLIPTEGMGVTFEEIDGKRGKQAANVDMRVV